MALDSRCYGDPAKHAKYPRETDRCYGCKHSITLFDEKFCDFGINPKKLKKPCCKWSKK